MRITLDEIAALVGGSVRGDGTLTVTGVGSLEEAAETELSFVGGDKHAPRLAITRARAVLAPPSMDTGAIPAVLVENPYRAWAHILESIADERVAHPSGIHPSAVIADDAQLGEGVAVGAYVVIEKGAIIGDGSILYPFCYIGARARVGKYCLFHPRVTVREDVQIGDRCVFQPGVVLGGDGFGFAQEGGEHHKIPHIGSVVIGDDVEVQANSAIDRGTTGATRIASGTKIDNLVHIAHNVRVGDHSLLCGQTGIAGSANVGRGVVLGGRVAVYDGVHVGDGAKAGGRTSIRRDVPAGAAILGTLGEPVAQELRIEALIKRLPKLFADVKALKSKLLGA